LDPMNALAAVEHLQQVAGNAIDVVKLNIDGARALQTTLEGAAQAGGRVSWSNRKEAWFLTLQAAYVFIRQGRLVDFNKLVCNAGCRFDMNFQRGVCQILGEIAANQLWDISSRRNAIDFLGGLYRDEARRNKNVTIQKCVVSILSRVSRMSWPDVSVHASSLLANLQEVEMADTETYHPLHTCLPQPILFPLLDRVLNIPEVEYDLDRMKFHRLQERLLPVFIPLRAKATPTSSHSDFPLMERVEKFLESDRQVFLLLGDSGSGKSLFCRQLEHALWGQYEVGRQIPLFINLPFIHRPEDDLIGKHLRNIPAHRVQEIKQHRQLVLICDGYDESRLTVNLHTTNGLDQPNVKMVISCRNTFLSSGYEGRFHPQGSDKYHDSSSRLFEEATIVPFSESDIQEFVTRYIMDPAVHTFVGNAPVLRQDNYLEKLKVIPNVMNLAKNPFLLTLALKALPSLSIDDLDQTQLKATQQDLYRGFIKEWIQVSKSRLNRASLRQKVQDVFFELLEADFEWCVRDYCKRLAEAIYLHQEGRPVVEYIHRNEKKPWKKEFFGSDIDSTLLREASPLTRAGIQHWFIHKSLLEYFLSLAVFDPDDSDQDGPDGGDDDDSNGEGGDSHGGGVSSFYDGDGGMVDDGGISGGGGSSSGGAESSSGGGGNPSGGGESSSDGGDNSSGRSGGSSDGNHNSIGEPGDSGASNDGSNGDGDDSQRRRDDARSKRKTRLSKSRESTSIDLLSKLNLFREPAVMQFLEERARSDIRFKKILSRVIEQSKSSAGPSLAAANAITILFKSGERFYDVNLQGVRVPSDYMLHETPELVPLAGTSLDGVDLLNALLAMTTPDNTQKATSTFSVAISSPKTSNFTPEILRQTNQHFSATLHRQLTALPVEKDKFPQSAQLFENSFEALENHHMRQAALTRDDMKHRLLALQMSLDNQLLHLQGRIQAILAQTYELHEYPIPRLFIILPKYTSRWDSKSLLKNQLQLYFLCECGEHTKVLNGDNTNIPHHIHIARHEGYDLQRPTDFIQKYGRYMLTLLEMIKYGCTTAGYLIPAMSSIGDSEANDLFTNFQDTFTPSAINQSIIYLQTFLSEQDTTKDPGTDSLAGQEALEGVDLRHLELFIKSKGQDRALGNLYRTITKEGHFKWVCINHYRMTYNDQDQQTLKAAVELNGGYYDLHLGRVTAKLGSKSQAAGFFDALAKARHVDELAIKFAWEGTTSDLDAFGDTLDNST
ncbi:WD_REPEATS_REGION domain-containing protein, partial [Linnemannia exigua]